MELSEYFLLAGSTQTRVTTFSSSSSSFSSSFLLGIFGEVVGVVGIETDISLSIFGKRLDGGRLGLRFTNLVGRRGTIQ